MARLFSQQEVLEQYHHIGTLEDELSDQLIALKLIAMEIQDVPQFSRGSPLPDIIAPSPVKMSLYHALQACIKPQAVFQYSHNLPKRFAGFIQLQANPNEYESIFELCEEIGRLRKDLVSNVVQLEPSASRRASLTKRLFPDILYQTLSRKIPLTPYTTRSVYLSWCSHQQSIKKLTPDDAERMVEAINKSTPLFQAQKNLDKLAEAKVVFKRTQVRVHPQAIVKFHDDAWRMDYITKKVHSPILILTSTQHPITYEPLKPFEYNKEGKDNQLKGYKPLIEGSCLVYKTSEA